MKKEKKIKIKQSKVEDGKSRSNWTDWTHTQLKSENPQKQNPKKKKKLPQNSGTKETIEKIGGWGRDKGSEEKVGQVKGLRLERERSDV